MYSGKKYNFFKWLIFICLLGLLLRLPGVLWGVYREDGHFKFSMYEFNEITHVDIAREFLDHHTDPAAFYPKGFAFQMAFATSFLKPFVGPGNMSNLVLVLDGRMLSVFYGILSIVLLFFLVKEVTSNEELALFSSLLLALSGLHVTRSHTATADISMTFWIYAMMYFLFLHFRKERGTFLIFAIISAGIALALKMNFIVLIPLVYTCVRNRWNWKKVMAGSLLLFMIFISANGFRYTLSNFFLTLHNLSDDNLSVRHYNKLINLYTYFLTLIASVGLPVFLLTIWGGCRIFSQRVKVHFNRSSRDIFFVILLPLMAHFFFICSMAYSADRHLLPLIPLLSVFAAAGLLEIKKSSFFSSKPGTILLIAGLITYQLIYILSIEYNFCVDTRKLATQWIEKNIPQKESISLPLYSALPLIVNDYNIVDFSKANYVVLHEGYYFRYCRSILNPLTPYPLWNDVFHPDRGGFLFCESLFKGQLPFRLVKKFETKFFTPEMIILKKLYGTPVYALGDVLIYKRNPELLADQLEAKSK